MSWSLRDQSRHTGETGQGPGLGAMGLCLCSLGHRPGTVGSHCGSRAPRARCLPGLEGTSGKGARTGRAGLCPGRGAVPCVHARSCGRAGTLRLFIGVRSSQPSRPPVSLGPWAPPASRSLPPPKTEAAPPLLLCRPPWEHLSVQEPVVGQVGRRASVGLGLGAQTWSVAPPWPLLSLCTVVERSLRAGGAVSEPGARAAGRARRGRRGVATGPAEGKAQGGRRRRRWAVQPPLGPPALLGQVGSRHPGCGHGAHMGPVTGAALRVLGHPGRRG